MKNLSGKLLYFFLSGLCHAYWEIAAHSTYDMFSEYKYLIVNLVFFFFFFFSMSVFEVGISF